MYLYYMWLPSIFREEFHSTVQLLESLINKSVLNMKKNYLVRLSLSKFIDFLINSVAQLCGVLYYIFYEVSPELHPFEPFSFKRVVFVFTHNLKMFIMK